MRPAISTEAIDAVFTAFVTSYSAFDELEQENKRMDLADVIKEISGDPEQWAKSFAYMCELELRDMEERKYA